MRSNTVFPDQTMELELHAHVAGEDGALGVQDGVQAAVLFFPHHRVLFFWFHCQHLKVGR